MAPSEELAIRAQSALDLVSRDTLARDRFTRAYTGTGDAILSLRAAADQAAAHVADKRLDALRRTAFGRTLSAAEEDAATTARRALVEDARCREQDAEAMDRAIRALEANFGTGLPSDPPSAPEAELSARRPVGVLRQTWIVPVAVLCLVLGYGGAGLSRQWAAPAPSVSDSASVKRLPVVDSHGAAQSGSTIAADEWFSQPQVEEDRIDAATLVNDLGIDPTTTRYVGSTVHGAWLWIAKRPDHGFCVVGMRAWRGEVFGSCTSLDDFVRVGLEFTQGRDSVRWDGIQFTTSSTTSVFG